MKLSKDNKIQTNHTLLENIYFVCLFIILFSLSIFNLALIFTQQKANKLNSYDPIQKKINFWRNFLQSYPEYERGWIEISKLEFQRGNIEAAKDASQQAEKINPNLEELEIVKKSLGFF